VNALVQCRLIRFTPQALPPIFWPFRGRESKCRTNALMLAWQNPGVTYVEGWANPQAGHEPVRHAFCVVDCRVLELTWEECGVAYAGFPVIYPAVCACILDPRRADDLETYEIDHEKINR